MALVGTRITASEVVAKFKNVFMSQVVEAAALPERHLYADPPEPEDEEGEEPAVEGPPGAMAPATAQQGRQASPSSSPDWCNAPRSTVNWCW